MVDVMGWLNLLLILIMASISPLKKLGTKNIKARKCYQKMRAIHPIMGILIIIIGLLHGYLALGTIKLHTGSLIVINLVLLALIAIIGPKVKQLRRRWRDIHKGLGFLLVVFLILHLFWRSLI
ncbi:hypothetical protein [Alkaliphilus transvaalensis]|uniref:hypothetical protein n=1 Tax=Alkaliphilus transvaalensis TaxID=114628 RepID=UPI0004790E8C|nr:hypothetical protein [Alkaliphilus transvaalensis]